MNEGGLFDVYFEDAYEIANTGEAADENTNAGDADVLDDADEIVNTGYAANEDLRPLLSQFLIFH